MEKIESYRMEEYERAPALVGMFLAWAAAKIWSLTATLELS